MSRAASVLLSILGTYDHIISHNISVISHTDTFYVYPSSDPDVIILSQSHVVALVQSVIVSINKAFISLLTWPILLILLDGQSSHSILYICLKSALL